MSSRDTAVVLVAGGTGERFGRSSGKQLAGLAGRPVLAHSFEACAAVARVGLVVVVCHPERVSEYAAAVGTDAPDVEVRFAAGGRRRQDSVAAGLSQVPDTFSRIAVHDGARPLAGPDLFDVALRTLDAEPVLAGVVIGHPAVDTLKMVEDGLVTATPDRTRFWAVQTPQVFHADALRAAYTEAARTGREGTDDASLVEAAGGAVRVLEGPRDNIKVTLAKDLAIAEALLAARSGRGT
ncbi:MAG: 2-C-methyl-D-erythritol 4-phosphate cytidylyltransferase [Coriobacteriia bacterium]|nr:2-C-methyl-D-erythritol 4-phosphate cytidylyltransferase [Coriobacteriia bacterium]